MKLRIGMMIVIAGVAMAQTPAKPPALFSPLPDTKMVSGHNPMTEAKVKLGRMLYYEPRLSLDNTVSCNSCHDLEKYGVDGMPTSKGYKGQFGGRNSPTVYHAAGHLAQFWDGRAEDVEQQAKGPVLNPIEMAMGSKAEVEWRLERIPGYVALFKEAFPGDAKPVTFNNMAFAIAAFERGLTTPSRFDRFLKGGGGMTPQEAKGFQEFQGAGCASCHNGTYLGGSSYKKLGQMKEWPSKEDVGRVAVTKQDKDTMVFKVPSLRNIEKTGPYFHDGKVATLEQAITLMGRHQLNRELTPQQVADIAAWMKTLTGEIPKAYIAKPELPQ